MIASPIPESYRSIAPVWLGPVRRIVAAHRPDDLASLNKASGERAALARVTSGGAS